MVPNKEKPALQGEVVNSEWLELMSASRKDFVKRLFGVFIREEPKRVKSIEKAFHNNDLNSLSFLAHSLKGAAATMGTERVRNLCASLDKAAKNSDMENAGLYVQILGEEMDKVYVFMNNYLSKE